MGTSLLSAIIVYNRDRKRRTNQFFALVFVGLAGFVAPYLFLQDPVLKEFSYILQLLGISVCILSLCLFYYALAHEGEVPRSVSLPFTGALFTSPVLCLIFHPFSFVLEEYGYELIIDTWFMAWVNVVYAIFVLYAILGLIKTYMRAGDRILRKKLEIIFIALVIMLATAIIFFTILPVVLNLHFLKPIGYGIITGCIIMMTYAFRSNRKN